MAVFNSFAFLTVLLFLKIGSSQECDDFLFRNLISTLYKSVQYTADHESEMNLDGVLSSVVVVEQMELLSKRSAMAKVPREIRNILNEIVIASNKTLQSARSRIEEIEYNSLGAVLKPGSWKLDYPFRRVDKDLIEDTRLTCSDIRWSWQFSDLCFSELVNFKEQDGNQCEITISCWKKMTRERYKDYPLTHQVLYLIFGEMHGCFKTYGEPMARRMAYLQDYFCANVYRDAEELFENGFPGEFRDLFLEQIGLCSLLGYTDFLRYDWIEIILSWPESNGCFIVPAPEMMDCSDNKNNLRKRRRKRDNMTLADKCSTHMTSVGVIAMFMATRFYIENMYGDSGSIDEKELTIPQYFFQ